MNALVLGGSWNIIGWIILAIAAVIVLVFVWAMVAVLYGQLESWFLFRWHRFWCQNGFHKKGAFEWSIEQTDHEDMATGDRVRREYDVATQRCTKCVKLLAQEKKLAKEDRFTRHAMRNLIPFGARWAERH